MAATVQREFQTIVKQSKWIAYAYKLVGLYSIPLLTIVTIISMTNVFTSGNFAKWPWVQTTWALIFAASIDVNIVRMFVEALIAHKQGQRLDKWIALSIGIGLMVVTGAALFLEGLQQSINLSWDDATVKLVIAILIGFRVLFVIVLMAREGLKLGQFLYDLVSPTEPEIEYPMEDQNVPPIDTVSLEETREPTTLHIVQSASTDVPVDDPVTLPTIETTKPTETAQQKASRILKRHPNLTATQLAAKAQITPQYAGKLLKKYANG